MKNKSKINWLSQTEEHDYPAAQSYLNLIFDSETAGPFIEKLKSAPIVHFKAKDIFRASGLPLLTPENFHVAKDVKKMKKGIALSPLLLVRQPELGKVIIADGYHRMCAVYSFDEDALIPCKIV